MLIQPSQRGLELLYDIDITHPKPGQLAIWWLGQSGYAFKTASALFYIDLYLSESLTTKYAATEKPHIRMTEAPLRGGDIGNAEWVIASHKHTDHLDPDTIRPLFAASPQAKLILPAALIGRALSLGLSRERLIPTRGDETVTAGPLIIHSIPSAHPGLDYSEATGYPFLGYVFELDGLKLYHSGDTILYDGLTDRLQHFRLDIAFLPINGTDARRTALKVAPNMNAEEAVRLAKEAGVRLLIPHHYDMFTFNTADVNEFARLAEATQQRYRILHVGEWVIVP